MLILAKQPKTNLSAPARNLLKIAGWRHQNVKTQLEFDKYAHFDKVLCNPIELNDGKNFTTMEWLMVFVKVPL